MFNRAPSVAAVLALSFVPAPFSAGAREKKEVSAPVARPQYADTAQHQDVIMDAPWYITPGRAEVPMLVFLPEIYWKGSRNYGVKLKDFILVNPRNSGWALADLPWFERQSILYRDTDAPATEDKRAIKQFITKIKDENGNPLQGIPLNEGVVEQASVQTPGWHRILQVPVNLLKGDGKYSYLAGYAVAGRVQMKSGQVVAIEETVEWRKMMRVQVGREGLPSLEKDRDHQFDPHFHTMSEYSLAADAYAPKQAFAGPWQMAVDCAFALGLTESDNRFNVVDKIISTDHSWEYIDTYFPEAGPFQDLVQARVDQRAPEVAGQIEYELMRSYFGQETGSQEAHMRRDQFVKVRHDPRKLILVAAAHTLVYRHPLRVLAPWHGMETNPQTIDTIVSMLKKGGGFTFGAHPYNGPDWEAPSMSWSDEYFRKGIQLEPHNDREQTRDGEFMVKGFQIWNERPTHANQSPFPSSRFAAMNPFAPTIDTSDLAKPPPPPASPVWVAPPMRAPAAYEPWGADPGWHEELSKGLIGTHRFVTEGFGYAFKDEPARRFLRKLYWLGATDAHGDFNYGSGHTATELDTPVLEYFNKRSVTSNAFGRVRTYVFGKTIDAMKKGQCLMTDGPVVEATLDTDLRFETPPPGQSGAYAWHDRWYGVQRTPRERSVRAGKAPPPQWTILRGKSAPLPLEDRYFTADGQVGGDGVFDGAHTLLTVAGNPYTVLRYRWTGNADFGGDVNRMELYKDEEDKKVRVRVEPATSVTIVERDATLPAYDDREWSYVPLHAVKADLYIPGVYGDAADPRVEKNAAFSLAAFTGKTENRRYHPDEFRCFTNPIWASPVSIVVRVANEPVRPDPYVLGGGPGGGGAADDSDDAWEPPEITVDFSFNLTMDKQHQPAICVKQLNAQGESAGAPQRLQAGRWVGVPGRLEDYWYQNATATLDAKTGTDWWYSTKTQDSDKGSVSFVVYMEDPVDFHGNRLNAIAKAFTATLRKRDGQQKSTASTVVMRLAPGQKKTVVIPTYCVDPHTPCFTLAPVSRAAVGAKRDAVPILLVPPGESERAKRFKEAWSESAAGHPIDLGLALEVGLVEAEARPVGQWLTEPAVLTNLASHTLQLVIPVGTVLTPTKTPRQPEFLLDIRGKRGAIEVALAAEDLARRGQIEFPRESPLRKALPRDRAQAIVTQWATWYVVNRETPEAMREALERAFPEDFAKLKEDPEALSAAARELWAIVERILARRAELSKAAAAGKFKWTSIDPYAAVTMGKECAAEDKRMETR